MKRNILAISCTALAFVFLLVSCSTAPNSKEQYLDNYSTFIKEIQEKKTSYSEADWKKKDEEFQKYSQELYSQFQGEMGLLEQGKIAKYAISYASARGSRALNDAVNSGNIDDAINEFKNLWNDDVKGDFDTAFEDLKQVWNDDLKQELEGKLDEVKAILEDEKVREDIKTKIDDIKDIVNDEELKGKVKDVMNELEEVLQEIEQKVNEK